MTISLIVAFSDNNIIGKNNRMPWKLSGDLKRFRELTTGHTVVMGRKTFESIGKPLPNRKNLVLTTIPESIIDCITSDSLKDAIEISGEEEELFIIGGGSVFRQAIPFADKLYVTEVHANVIGDAEFPEIDPNEWEENFREEHKADEKNEYDYTFVNYVRKKKSKNSKKK